MKWLKSSDEEPLAVSMAGVRLGDRLLVVGGSDSRLLAGVAAKTGLTGRACVVDENQERSSAAAAAAERDGALVEAFTAPWTALPFGSMEFDVAVVRNVLPQLTESLRVACLREVLRLLRPGGRGLVIDGMERAGLQSLIPGRSQGSAQAAADALGAAGFRAVRTLAERGGLIFVEGVRPNE
jgi:ubiquinone/menaquinone biosynthesis C-methylase UbiE